MDLVQLEEQYARTFQSVQECICLTDASIDRCAALRAATCHSVLDTHLHRADRWLKYAQHFHSIKQKTPLQDPPRISNQN